MPYSSHSFFAILLKALISISLQSLYMSTFPRIPASIQGRDFQVSPICNPISAPPLTVNICSPSFNSFQIPATVRVWLSIINPTSSMTSLFYFSCTLPRLWASALLIFFPPVIQRNAIFSSHGHIFCGCVSYNSSFSWRKLNYYPGQTRC